MPQGGAPQRPRPVQFSLERVRTQSASTSAMIAETESCPIIPPAMPTACAAGMPLAMPSIGLEVMPGACFSMIATTSGSSSSSPRVVVVRSYLPMVVVPFVVGTGGLILARPLWRDCPGRDGPATGTSR